MLLRRPFPQADTGHNFTPRAAARGRKAGNDIMGFQLNEDSLTPLYQQLMEDIKTSLAEGKYMPDEKIPSEPELSELYLSLIHI